MPNDSAHSIARIPSTETMRGNMADTSEPEALTPEEQQLLDKYIPFYRDLETGRRQPETEEQKHFVRVTLGQAVAETPHEMAYAKYMGMQHLRRHRMTEKPEARETIPQRLRDWERLAHRRGPNLLRWMLVSVMAASFMLYVSPI